MATQMTAAQLRAAFTKWGVNAKYYSGYETRGNGSIANMSGIMIHHTGSDAQSDSYLNFLFVVGRSDVPPPLANFATRMNGELWVGALEQANHAGQGDLTTLSKARTGNYDWRNTEISPGPDDFTGNDYYYGNEVMFDGGQPITGAAWLQIILSCAAICDFYGWGAWHVIGHKEHTTRKWDPGNTLMYKIRRDVDAALKAGPGWPNTQEDDVALTPAQEAAIAKAGWLADQFAQGAQFETDIDVIQGDLQEVLTTLATIGQADVALTDTQVQQLSRASWLSDQFAQGAQFEVDLNEILAALATLTTTVDALRAEFQEHAAPKA